jgi:hypothetical protein
MTSSAIAAVAPNVAVKASAPSVLSFIGYFLPMVDPVVSQGGK